MRIPISWLKDFVDIPATLTVEELAERLTLAGLEVEKIDYIGIAQQTPDDVVVPPSDHLVWDAEKLVLGRIHEVTQHPDADRLVLAMIDHGQGEPEQIVTGAPNLFAYLGAGELEPPIPVPIAREGAVVYDGHADEPGKRMTLKERKIRGIPNKHMVCSEMELGISEAHEGVLLLPPEDYGDIPPGTPLVEVLGDAVLDIDLTPNLARCFSILGVAREVAAVLDVPLNEPDYRLPDADAETIREFVSLDIHAPELNPRFTLALLQDVTIQPSPWWMQYRLKLIGQRPINNIVDVTNYVMFEIGQPAHAFDYDILKARAEGGPVHLITRLPEEGEELTTLDGKTHHLAPHNLLVADDAGGLSLAGVMGGEESEVQDATDDHPGSQTVLLEAAAWNLINIRQTLSSTKLHSEAAARFSRGVHPAQALRGLYRAAALMAEVSGATLVPGVLDEYPAPPEPVVVDLPLGEITRILGFEISGTEAADILRRLQFTVAEAGQSLRVTAPDHRLDIGTGATGQADLLEEIARIYGYNRIPNTLMADDLPPQRDNTALEREEITRDILARIGLREVINYRLTTPEHEARLVPPESASDWGIGDYVTLANPITSDKTVMRQTLLAGLLDIAAHNARYQSRQAIFEIGSVYLPREGEPLPDEPRRLAILMTGARGLADWQAEDTARLDYFDLKGVIERLLDGLSVPAEAVRIEATQHSTFWPGRAAQLVVDGHALGVFGQVHPLVPEQFGLPRDLETPVLAAELDLEGLLAVMRTMYPIQPIYNQPAVYQDMAVVVPRDLPAADLESAIWAAGGDLLVGVKLFDVYTGEQIPADKKSMAYALTYQHPEETLTDKRVAKVHNKIVKALEKQVGAQLRG